jgi:NADPH:quinone reductase-like Zn-dependent oxidoreductase
MSDLMKAVGFYKYGGPEVLQKIELEDPVPGKNDVIIRTKCTSFNSLDAVVRSGRGDPRIKLPHVPGCDLVGTVESVGEEVKDASVGELVLANTVFGCGNCKFCKKGDEISCSNWQTIGMQTHGSYGELVKVPASVLIRPSNYSVEELACMPMSLSVAWRSLHVLAKAKKNESVLIWGASGNVGVFAIMIAKAMGLKVMAVTRGDKKRDVLLKLGADYVLDYSKGVEGIAKEVKDATKGNGADIILEAFGGTLNDSIGMARQGGSIILFGTVAGMQSSIGIMPFYRKSVRVMGTHNANKLELTEALEFISEHNIRPVIAETMSIQEAARAHQLFDRGEQPFGKIVLKY